MAALCSLEEKIHHGKTCHLYTSSTVVMAHSTSSITTKRCPLRGVTPADHAGLYKFQLQCMQLQGVRAGAHWAWVSEKHWHHEITVSSRCARRYQYGPQRYIISRHGPPTCKIYMYWFHWISCMSPTWASTTHIVAGMIHMWCSTCS